NQHERSREIRDRGGRRADVRALRIVDVLDTAPGRYRAAAMRQSLEARERLERGIDPRSAAADRLDEHRRERERGERVRLVVTAAQQKRVGRHERMAVARKPATTVVLEH